MKMPNEVICEEIKKNGIISVADFMECALYCPETGYYERKKDIVGRKGDFITSVSVGGMFGELLAFQLAEWLEEIQRLNPPGAPLHLVEAGAHDGRLAADILGWLETERPKLFAGVKYLVLEPSVSRQAWQKETLKKFAPRVCWHGGNVSTLPDPVRGVIFSNELLDAFPVRQFCWDACGKEWFERGVTFDGTKLTWAGIKNSDMPPVVRQLPAALLEVLPDGYIVEDSPAATAWWRAAARVLAQGKLMAVDYGITADELVSPARQCGTLRAYFQHHVADDVLANPGEQDLTAHVNFSAVQAAGEAAGLKTEIFCTQPQFLTRILQAAGKKGSFASLNARQIRQFQTLTHPEHLGRAFRVLVQSR